MIEIGSETIIREGGTNPLKTESWENWVKLHTLELLHDFPRVVRDIEQDLLMDNNYREVKSKFNHHLKVDEIEKAIREMYRDHWIEVEGYKCGCCEKLAPHPWQEILKHVSSFKLTKRGRDLVPKYKVPVDCNPAP